MSPTVEKLIEEAKQLTTTERLQLAQELLEGLESEEDEDTVRAWEDEIERRISRLDQSATDGRSWDEIKKDFESRYGQ